MGNEKSFFKVQKITEIESIKGITILWLFLVHFIERFIQGSFFANPSATWPSLSERFLQIKPFSRYDFSGIFANFLRYVGWCGDQGVQIFLIISGFSLTYSVLKHNKKLESISFFKKRLIRIYPEWLTVHFLLIASYIFVGRGLNPTSYETILSFFGIRFLPKTMYYFSPAWWFISLILQLYLIFPILILLVQSTKPIRNLLLIISGALLVRAIGLYNFHDNLDWWSRGGISITRLPEFTAGILFAVVAQNKPEFTQKISSGKKNTFLWILIWIIGNLASFFLLGMTIAFLVTGVSLFILLLILIRHLGSKTNSFYRWVGRNSLSIFLVHHPVLLAIVPTTLSIFETGKVIFYFCISFSISIIFALIVKQIASRIVLLLTKWKAVGGYRLIALIMLLFFCISFSFLIAIEFSVRLFNPQEVLGWGERKSLTSDEIVGYKLKPDSVTRLRWLSYDYTVSANKLGFPGALYPETKTSGTFRIFVTGDAFESAEGVDTNNSWPILMEGLLRQSKIQAEVFNFSITGWGPQHYDRAISTYAPIYYPDLIIVGLFVNDLFDVTITDEEFHNSIGFNKKTQNSLHSYITMIHFRYLRENIKLLIKSKLLGTDYWLGSSFSHIESVRTANRKILETNVESVAFHMQSIVNTSNALNCEVLVVLVPSSIQICESEDLPYITKAININDLEKYDLNQPQEIMHTMLSELDLPMIDLRSVLSSSSQCPYQPKNMHFTIPGHQIVAESLSNYIMSSEVIR